MVIEFQGEKGRVQLVSTGDNKILSAFFPKKTNVSEAFNHNPQTIGEFKDWAEKKLGEEIPIKIA